MPAPRGDRRLTRFLASERNSGVLVVAAAGLGLLLANSPLAAAYESFRSLKIGIAEVHLNLSVATWAADGLLAIFFFVIGIELKREFTQGSLSRPSRAALPIAAAFGGMALPALIYAAINISNPDGSLRGWGIPMATDIAFALAVLSVFGRGIPTAIRGFLLTLAIVDDLGAIAVIALFYSSSLNLAALLAAGALIGGFWMLQRARIRSWPLYLALGLSSWVALHESGVHATIAGVALGLATRGNKDPGEDQAPAERWEQRLHPLSAGFAAPLFAFTAAGITIEPAGIAGTLDSPIFLGVVFGLVVGKPLGIFLAARFASALLGSGPPSGGSWADVSRIGIVAGIGFTVALLIAELAYAGAAEDLAAAKSGVILASLLSAAAAAVTLLRR